MQLLMSSSSISFFLFLSFSTSTCIRHFLLYKRTRTPEREKKGRKKKEFKEEVMDTKDDSEDLYSVANHMIQVSCVLHLFLQVVVKT